MENDIRSRLIEDTKISDKKTVCEFPKKMLLEPTNACNDSCLFCANSKCTKMHGFIDRELAYSILEQAYKLGTYEVGFYGTGEPLLDRNLEEYVSYAKRLGYKYVYITTNGALLSQERSISLIEAGIDSVKFSINGSNVKDYYLIHGKDEFEQVIENLICFDNLRKQAEGKIRLYVSYILTRYTCAEKEEFKTKYSKYADDIVFFDCQNIAGCMADEVSEYLSVNHNMGYHPKDGVCPMIFNCLHVTYEGYLTMCCADFQNYLAVADLNKESLEEVWNNSYAQELRRRHLDHNLEGTLCFNCINNCYSHIRPLREDCAVILDEGKWDKSEEIEERIRTYQLINI